MRAKEHFERLLTDILGRKGLAWPDKAVIEPPKDKRFGELSANVAMLAAGQARTNPRALAEDIARAVRAEAPEIAHIEVAGPGFLNASYAPAFWQRTAALVLDAGPGYGAAAVGAGKHVQVEFVSANPTGPLHIGHGRGAALGDSLARILRKAGFCVSTEYYINDAGRQMRLLGLSIYYRLRETSPSPLPEPEDYYRGAYIKDLAKEVAAKWPDILARPEAEAVDLCFEHGMAAILEGIKQDLKAFGVAHDVWYSERELVASGRVEETFRDLLALGLAFEQDGALWLRTTAFGDDNDRVLRKSGGELTYFASDIAYHADKFRRGFDLVIDIWGADHHGYVPRMQAATEILGRKGQLSVILVQLVNLLQGGVQIAMSTRAGQFETLADVLAEVGPDAARFIFLSRKSDSHLDFDLELVKQKSMDNPVYYVQYAHARICSVLRKAAEQGLAPGEPDEAVLARLNTPEDIELLRQLDRLPDAVESAARTLSPHLVGYFLQELASLLHKYYTVHHVLSAEPELCRARLLLLSAVARVLRNGLELLWVGAPESM